MRTLAQDKYTLRDLHREIDLLDRKLNHILKFETFESDALRDAAARKATTKREQLTAQARSLIDLGIEYQIAEVPRSLRSDAENQAVQEAEKLDARKKEVIQMEAEASENQSEFGAQIDRIRLDNATDSPLAAWQDDLEAYKRRRQRTSAA